MFNPYCNGFYHTVVQGDTLYALSRKYQVPLQMIMRANPYVNVYNLRIGSQLCIPIRRRPFPPGVTGNTPPQSGPGPAIPDRPQASPGPVVPDRPQASPGPVVPDRPADRPDSDSLIQPRSAPNFTNLEQEMSPVSEPMDDMLPENNERTPMEEAIDPDIRTRPTNDILSQENDGSATEIGPGMRGVPVTAHLVEPGETMMQILDKTGLKLYEFVELNPLEGLYLKEGTTYYTAK